MFSFLRRRHPRVIPTTSIDIDAAIAQLIASASSLIQATRQDPPVSRDDYYADYRRCYLMYGHTPFNDESVYTRQADHLINRLTDPLFHSDITLEEHLRDHFTSFSENIIIELVGNTLNTERAQTGTRIDSTSTEELSFNRLL